MESVVALECMEAHMQNFVRQQNIKLLQEALKKEADTEKRRVLEALLAKEGATPAEAKQTPPS